MQYVKTNYIMRQILSHIAFKNVITKSGKLLQNAALLDKMKIKIYYTIT